MNSLQDLLHFILRHDNVVVFGNLGRNPQVVYKMLHADPHLQVVVQSQFYFSGSSPDNRIRMVTHGDIPPDPIDLFVVLEPEPYKLLQKPHQAVRWVVFTSHLTFKSRPETVWTHVCYFHSFNLTEMCRNTQRLLQLQDTSFQTANVNDVRVNAVNTVVVPRQKDTALSEPNTFVIVDLTQYTHPFTMSLAFWDSFDYMLKHVDFIQGWRICFPLKFGRAAFEQFIQTCLDTLFCKRFEHGNVTSLNHILTLLPYYKSGCIDQTFNVPKRRFLGAEIIAPINPDDICKAATMHNLEHWAGNVYRIKN
ncbi:hypothetical protein JTE90_022621 [Oedothorax gibbosus]|uniref:Uncharacterized protein n=1 Tax=Oedothorax gibbosus TaxID=931172 RepID=A0AAV6TUA6_9ARAC|nr:hypothetical protein JTE90_026412 [Oedothorax gibbosus]KAG8175198.1 hypothetical protein JTE90_022621 [Oedothorax gibbosus]